MNRRIRNRTYGGVGGGAPQGAPLPDPVAEALGRNVAQTSCCTAKKSLHLPSNEVFYAHVAVHNAAVVAGCAVEIEKEFTMKIDGFDKFLTLGKENADAVAKSGAAAMKGFEDFAKASQAYVAKSTEKADAAVKALMSVKTPAELADLQTKLARDSIETVISEGRKFAELSQIVLTAALEPLNARVAAFQSLAKAAA